MEKLDKTIGNKTQWDICQSQIAESGQSKLIEIHSNTTIIYKKVFEKYIKRVKQYYQSQKNQPSFVPKFVQLRNSYSEMRRAKPVPQKVLGAIVSSDKVGENKRSLEKAKSIIPTKRKVVEVDTRAHKTPSNDLPYVENIVLRKEQKDSIPKRRRGM